MAECPLPGEVLDGGLFLLPAHKEGASHMDCTLACGASVLLEDDQHVRATSVPIVAVDSDEPLHEAARILARLAIRSVLMERCGTPEPTVDRKVDSPFPAMAASHLSGRQEVTK